MQVRSFALGRMLHVLGLAMLLGLCSGDHSRNKAGHADIYMVDGPDREQRLIEGAKKDGTVALYLYISLNAKDPAVVLDESQKWAGIWSSMFLKNQGVSKKSDRMARVRLQPAGKAQLAANEFVTAVSQSNQRLQ